MKRIFKYPVEPGYFTVKMPRSATVLSAQAQGEQPFMWALADDQDVPTQRQFVTYGTGEPLPDEPGQFVDTFQIPTLALTFHLFEVPS